MPVYYADASALVKLVAVEPQTPSLNAFVRDAELVSCELVLTEVPRAVRRQVAREPDASLETVTRLVDELFMRVTLLPLEAELLAFAGSLPEPALRSLDAVHVAAAIELSPLDGFITYDVRQAAAARLSGLRTASPGT